MSFLPIVDEIERSLAAQVWFPPLATTLLLPDACGAIDAREVHPRDKYKRWFRDNVGDMSPNERIRVDAEVVYRLRNSIMHENVTFTRANDGYDRVIFMPPTAPGVMHLCVSRNNGGVDESALILDLSLFISEIVGAVMRWEQGLAEDATDERRARMDRLIKLHPLGITPHGYGMAMIG